MEKDRVFEFKCISLDAFTSNTLVHMRCFGPYITVRNGIWRIERLDMPLACVTRMNYPVPKISSAILHIPCRRRWR